jgi:hypothetical protein
MAGLREYVEQVKRATGARKVIHVLALADKNDPF